MRKIMKATWTTEVTQKSGERYICDACGKVFADTTQIEDDTINRYPDIPYFSVTADNVDMHACSHACVRVLFNEWNKACESKKDDSGCIINVSRSHLRINNILNKYNHNNTLSTAEWNRIKKEKSTPIESS